MQSLEKFGFYVTTETGVTRTVTQYELFMEKQAADPTQYLIVNGMYVENEGLRTSSVKTFTPDTSYDQRLIQQTSIMY